VPTTCGGGHSACAATGHRLAAAQTAQPTFPALPHPVRILQLNTLTSIHTFHGIQSPKPTAAACKHLPNLLAHLPPPLPPPHPHAPPRLHAARPAPPPPPAPSPPPPPTAAAPSWLWSHAASPGPGRPVCMWVWRGMGVGGGSGRGGGHVGERGVVEGVMYRVVRAVVEYGC
jgi:hypothetical protein